MRERLNAKPNQVLIDYIFEPHLLEDAGHSFYNMMRCNMAQALMLHKAGIITDDEAKTLTSAIARLTEEGPEVLEMNPDYEDLFYNVETYLIKLAGLEIAGKLHTARSRNDLGATTTRMMARDYILTFYPKVLALRKQLVKLAEDNLDTVMTGYTHMQPAQPITLGFYFTGVAQALQRDWDRLINAYSHLNLCPLGSCACAGTSFPVYRDYLAALTGFTEPLDNCLDAVASREYFQEYEAAFTILSTNLNRMAHDLYYWMTNEFGYLELDNSIAASSSIMPQKKNAITLELVKGKMAHILASFVSSSVTMKGIPFGHTQETFLETAHSFSDSSKEMDSILALLQGSLDCLIVHGEHAKERADINFCTATELADEIVKKEGVSFRVAHELVGSVVGQCADNGLTTRAITTAMLDEAGEKYLGHPLNWTAEHLAVILDSGHSIENKTSQGAPGAASVRETLAKIRRRIETDEKALGDVLAEQTGSEALLAEEYEKVQKRVQNDTAVNKEN